MRNYGYPEPWWMKYLTAAQVIALIRSGVLS